MTKVIKVVVGLDNGDTSQQEIPVPDSVKCICDVSLVETKQVTDIIETKHIGDPPKKPEPKEKKPEPNTEAGDVPAQ